MDNSYIITKFIQIFLMRLPWESGEPDFSIGYTRFPKRVHLISLLGTSDCNTYMVELYGVSGVNGVRIQTFSEKNK